MTIAVLLLFLHFPTIQAQHAIDMRSWSHTLYENQSGVSLRGIAGWNSDSSYFWTWEFQYNTQTGQTTLNPPQPLHATLPASILAVFGIDTSDPNHPRAYYSVSPNGEYVAYSVVIDDRKTPPYDEPKCVTRQIRIGHIPSLTIKATDVQVMSGVEYTWFGDSAAILISATSPCAPYYGEVFYGYINSLSPSLTTMNVTDVFFRNQSIGGLEVNISRMTQASRDGTRALLIGSGYSTLVTNEYPVMLAVLILLDTQTPSNSHILVQGERIPNNAFFKYGDEGKLLLISEEGFVEYDLNTNQTTVLDATFDGLSTYDGNLLPYDETYVLDSTVSPNGRWLIYSHWDVESGNTTYYVVDLAQALYSDELSDRATPTNLPTYTPIGVGTADHTPTPTTAFTSAFTETPVRGDVVNLKTPSPIAVSNVTTPSKKCGVASIIEVTYSIIAEHDEICFIRAVKSANALSIYAPSYEIFLTGDLNFSSAALAIPRVMHSLEIYGNNSLFTVSGGNPLEFVAADPPSRHVLSHMIITNGGDMFIGLYGGAITNKANLSIFDSIFTDNAVRNGGGAIYNAGTLYLERVRFTDNHAGGGGAIQIDYGGSLRGECVTFDGNSGLTGVSSGYGQSILIGSSGGTVALRKSSFRTKYVTSDGSDRLSQLFNLSDGSFTVTDSYFESSKPSTIIDPSHYTETSSNVEIYNPQTIDPTLGSDCSFHAPKAPPYSAATATPSVTITPIKDTPIVEDFSSHVIYTGNDLKKIRWSNDSEKLILSPDDFPITTTASPNIVYDVQTKTSEERAGWALQPELTAAEKAAFSPVEGDGATSFMFASPDGNFIAYARATSADPSRSGTLAIASRQTLTVVMTDIRIDNAIYIDGFQVFWSADNTSFAVQVEAYTYDIADIYYVANANTSNPTTQHLDDLSIGGEIYESFFQLTIYDIDDDGTTVLIRMAEQDLAVTYSFDQIFRIVAWQPRSPSSSKVLTTIDAKDVSAASFVGEYSDRVMLIDLAGLTLFDLTTGTQKVVTTEFNTIGYEHPKTYVTNKRGYFSPDSRWLAFVEFDVVRSYPMRLRLIDLSVYNLDTSLPSTPIR
ncbi:MAG: hypothetical protein KF726_27080 [Anaerolineae bacterium]|nr:hypothetical protein [Anaerolineae bacterium]